MCFRITHKATASLLTPTGTLYDEVPETCEWITPSGWTEQQAIESFEKRFSGRRVISCRSLLDRAVA